MERAGGFKRMNGITEDERKKKEKEQIAMDEIELGNDDDEHRGRQEWKKVEMIKKTEKGEKQKSKDRK